MFSDLDQNLYAFVLGRELEIALAELEAVLHRFNFVFDKLSVSGNVALINVVKTGDCGVASLAEILGGTVKIFKIIDCHSDQAQRAEAIRPCLRHECNRMGSLHSQSLTGRATRGSEEPSDSRRDDDRARIGVAALDKQISDFILAEKDGITYKLHFGISAYVGGFASRRINALGLEVKKWLKARFSVRFVEVKEGTELSSIQSLKNQLHTKGIEIGIFKQGIGVLVGLSNAEEWSVRDYEKPAGDKYSGMTPPKLARMLVNIAIENSKLKARNSKEIKNSNLKNSEIVLDFEFRALNFHDCVVVDPFCGSGNILMEAMMLGCDVIGSDISEKAVNDSQENISWLKSEILNPKSESNPEFEIAKSEIFQADVTTAEFKSFFNCHSEEPAKSAGDVRIPSHVRQRRFAIVTEPYLGQPKKFAPSLNSARGEYTKIKPIYLSFLRNMRQLEIRNSKLKERSFDSPATLAQDDTRIINLCVVFPLVETVEKRQFSLFCESVDEIKELGYTQVRPSLIYGRDYQVVKREIVFLKLK